MTQPYLINKDEVDTTPSNSFTAPAWANRWPIECFTLIVNLTVSSDAW